MNSAVPASLANSSRKCSMSSPTLLQHRDRVVTKHELLENLWPDQFISEVTLNHCLMVARKAIGDSGRTQRCIKTLHGRGYRFIAAVQERVIGPSAISAGADG